MLRYLTLGVLMLSSTAALAEGPSYSFIQALYQQIDIDDAGDGDGYGVAGSVAIDDSWFVFAGYSSFDPDDFSDVDQIEVGGGWHSPISSTTDWFVTASYLDVDYGPGSEDGFGVGVGVRSMFSPSLELYGQVNYEDVFDGDTSVGAGAWYTLSGNLALGAAVEFGDDVTSYGVGIRLYFDK